MTGAHSVARALAALGVDVAHVLPGEETIALIEALRDVDIELVVCRHEQHAAFMAATRGRLLGTPGLVVTTIGPGATNAVTGLAHATLGGFPLLHLSGQKALRDNDEGRFQLLDIRAVTAPVTKGTHLVTDPIDAASVTASAARLAASPRPGAVTVVVPQDVALGEVPERPDLHVSHTSRSRAAAPAMDHAVEVVRAARRPVVLFGGGAQQLPATAAQRFIEALVAPGVALQTGHGVVPDDHDLCFRPLGMHRHDVANSTIDEADLVIAVGVDPVEHPPANWNRADLDVIHVAEWPARLGVDYLPRVEVVGNLRDALEQLGSRVSDDVPRRDRAVVAARRDQQRAALDHEPTRLEAGADSGLAPIDVVEAVADDVGPDGIVALDNGAYKLWFARHHPTRRRHGLLLDNALATMGAGLAIGTEAARLERETPVVAVVGDGGFLMNVGDLETAVRHDCRNLTAVVLRDDAYGFIVDHQKERGRAETAVRLGNPDVVRLAESFGCRSLRATSRRELVEALDVCRRHAGVSVVDVPLDARHHELLR